MFPNKTFKKSFQVFLAKSLIHVLAQLSLKNCHRVGSFLGWLFFITPNKTRAVTKKNIQLCFPELNPKQQKQLCRNSLIETGKTLTEASPMWQWEKNKLLKLIKHVQGEELLQKSASDKNGIILAFPHLGNWELLNLYCSAKYPITTMYQKPKLVQIDAIVKNGRERLGAHLVPADNQGVRAMLKALKNNEFVCILPDQEPSKGNGVFAPFFGIKAYSMTLISRLAKKTNATLLIAYAKRLPRGNGYEVFFSEVADLDEKLKVDEIENSVSYINAEVEKCIRNIPAQYQWSYKRFRTQPVKEGSIKTDFYNS